MNPLSEQQKTQFDQAVATFEGEGVVSVTAEKLQAFLEATQDSKSSPAEWLRQLAIELEHEEFETGWNGLRAIYQAAASADPTNALVLHSWGISASYWMEEWKTTDLSERPGTQNAGDGDL